MYGQNNLYSLPLSIVDALCMAILGCIGGAMTAWLLGKISTKTS
jgi:membrane protein YqaA with SNARE-associated domain